MPVKDTTSKAPYEILEDLVKTVADKEQDEEIVEILGELEEEEFVSEGLSYHIKMRIEYERNL